MDILFNNFDNYQMRESFKDSFLNYILGEIQSRLNSSAQTFPDIKLCQVIVTIHEPKIFTLGLVFDLGKTFDLLLEEKLNNKKLFPDKAPDSVVQSIKFRAGILAHDLDEIILGIKTNKDQSNHWVSPYMFTYNCTFQTSTSIT